MDLELTYPVRGWVTCRETHHVSFNGWMQLHSVLESICAAARPDAGTAERRDG